MYYISQVPYVYSANAMSATKICRDFHNSVDPLNVEFLRNLNLFSAFLYKETKKAALDHIHRALYWQVIACS